MASLVMAEAVGLQQEVGALPSCQSTQEFFKLASFLGALTTASLPSTSTCL